MKSLLHKLFHFWEFDGCHPTQDRIYYICNFCGAKASGDRFGSWPFVCLGSAMPDDLAKQCEYDGVLGRLSQMSFQYNPNEALRKHKAQIKEKKRFKIE